jgi:hypothetical protein
MKSLMLLIALSISVLFQPSLAFAAEITPVENHPMGCEYKVTGLINNGDAEKVDKVLKQNNWFEVASRGWKICLDSPGGSFVEGVKLAKAFATNSIGTVVAQSNVCESACAIAFMGGSYFNPEGENRYVSRTIHPTAKLGFHAPALLIPEGSYSKEEVDKAYSIALSAVVELSEMRALGYEIRESLFKAILTTPFESMHYVDTVGKALRYKIGVAGINISSDNVQSIAANVCDNAVIAIDDVEEKSSFGSNKFVMIGDVLISPGGYYAEASADCQVQINPTTNSFLVSFHYGNSEPFFSSDISSFASFPSKKLLASAFSEQSITGSDFLQKAHKALKKDRASDRPQTCGIMGTSLSITNVQNFTNLRRQAGLNGQVIGQVPLGAQVFVVNPGNFLRRDRCAAACNGTNQNAIKQCIDNNDVWIEVQYNGRRGFLSRKFLE